ncbi:MAG TPA: carboxypeptidase regulatory-like domain-containing protein [Bryobacteraceae bacterium]|nr:carboxypeptidase regulatory-like domain-containing protein [Bryobacteraceae bacterium]
MQRCSLGLGAKVLFGLIVSGMVYGQGFGTIVGTITDASGAVVPAAQVKITDEATSAVRETTANDQGYYVVPALRPSTYTVTANAPGFEPSVHKGIVLLADQSLTVNAAVAVKASTQTVEVSAAAAQVNTTNATNSEVVDQRRVTDLPLNGRNAASLLTIVAGAIPSPANDVDQGNTKTFPVLVTVSTNGSRQNQVNFRLDGAPNTDIYTNVNQPFPFPDALQEFSVQTANYPAKFGGNAGGVVNVVTKSGTNSFHGGAFEFNRNAVFNARNFFAASRDQLKRNQYGGTIGGPIKIPHVYDGSNKDFFFFGYQGTRIRNVSGTSSAYFPLAQNLTGDFSNVLSASDPANPFAKTTTIIDPLNGQPFANNQIPANRLDPAALAFTKYIPVLTSGNGRLFYSQPLGQNFGEYVARVDHSFSENDKLSGRYFNDIFNNNPFLDKSNYLNNSNFSTIEAQNALLSETHIFSPNKLNEVRLTFARETANRGPAPGSLSLADLGVKLYQPPVNTLEGINISGFFNVAQTDPAAFIRNQYNISDDFNWVHGKHSIGIGGTAMRGQVLLRNQFRTSGSFTFTSDVTNDALASFLMGYVRTFSQGFGEFKDNLMSSYSLYIQDDYHISRRLTLNLGLRWDPFVPWTETKNRAEQFDLSNYYAGVTSQVYVNAPPGLRFPGDPGMPRAGLYGSYDNFAPRVGFAYDVFGDGKTSIRGGAGMFYDSLQAGTMNNRVVDLTPFSPQISLTQPQGSFSNPYLGIVDPYPSPFPPPKDTPFPGPVLVVTYDTAHGSKAMTPAVYNWNLMVEHQLEHNWVLRAGYVGSRSTHLMESLELNPAIYTPGSKLGTDQRRALQPLGSISEIAMDINSNFDSLQLTAQKRFGAFTVLANYTWAKSLDTLPYGLGIAGPGGGGSPISWFRSGRHQYDYGPSEFDHSQRFVMSYIYDFPKLANANKVLRAVAGGWQWTGILTYQTGGPLTIMAGKDQSQTGVGTDRANYLGGPVYGSGACGSSVRCVDYLVPGAFGLPDIGGLGNTGKGEFRGPDLLNWDTGVFKEFPLHAERVRLQFRAEFFNVTNRVNFNNPNITQSAGGFGSITSATDPRIGQLALKLAF